MNPLQILIMLESRIPPELEMFVEDMWRTIIDSGPSNSKLGEDQGECLSTTGELHSIHEDGIRDPVCDSGSNVGIEGSLHVNSEIDSSLWVWSIPPFSVV